jgi:hypothetical protein
MVAEEDRVIAVDLDGVGDACIHQMPHDGSVAVVGEGDDEAGDGLGGGRNAPHLQRGRIVGQRTLEACLVASLGRERRQAPVQPLVPAVPVGRSTATVARGRR